MTGLSIDDAKAAKNEARQGDLRENSAGIAEDQRVNYEEDDIEQVKLHPNVLVTGSHVARISINTYGNDENLLAMEQNLQGAPPYGYDLQLTIADPEVIDGQVWDPDTDDEYAETRILGDPEASDNPYEIRESIVKDDDGNPVDTDVEGVGDLPGGNSWDAQPRDGGFDDVDFIEISISASRAMDVLGSLDTAGMWFTDTEGNVVEGLFEAPPRMGTDDYDSDEDGYPRLTGYPELRADMVGEKVAVSCLYDEDDPDTRSAVSVDIHRVTDDGLETLVSLTSEDDAYAKPTYPRVNNTYWDDTADSDAEPQTEGGMEAAKNAMSDDLTYEDLDDDGQDFVETAATVVEERNLDTITDLDGVDTDSNYDSFSDRVEMDNRDFRASADELATIVDSYSDN